MTFSATDRLWLLAVLVGVVAAYVVRQRRRARDAAAFTSTAMLASVAPRRPGRRRHLAAVGVVVGSALAVIAFAGPAHAVRSARPGATVVLALDISPSMAANDVVPTRIRAAQAAAIRFTKTLPQRFRLGLVTFGGIAHVDALPTSNHRAVLEELSHLELEPRTAIGEAIFASLDAIRSANANAVIESGRRPSARIVLLSDGDTNAGRSNEDATAAALRSRVPVSTIAFGTNGSGVDIFGESVYVAPNIDALRQIALTTGGHFSDATDVATLRQAYARLEKAIVYVSRRHELTSWFVGAALVCLLLAGATGLVLSTRLA